MGVRQVGSDSARQNVAAVNHVGPARHREPARLQKGIYIVPFPKIDDCGDCGDCGDGHDGSDE